MKLKFISLGLWVFCLALPEALAREGTDSTIPLERVPKPVLAAVKKKFPDGKLLAAIHDVEEDQSFFEIELKSKNHEIFVICDPSGKILEVDKRIAFQELPRSVKQTVQKRDAQATVLSVEEVQEDNHPVHYAVLLKQGQKTLHLLLNHTGKIVEEELYEGDDPPGTPEKR
jgi:Putative beta-lactamase-inhibitor-like, PepSY-like